jgi:Fe/S biogenesis protein NfuA
MEKNNIIDITKNALDYISEALNNEDESDLALWIEVSGQNDGEYTYDLYFENLSDAAESDTLQEFDHLRVIIPEKSCESLTGATLDYSVKDGDSEAQLVLINPNRPKTFSLDDIPGNLESDLAKKVNDVLNNEINPAISGHGGAAELLSIDGSTAYIKLSGGCQGCAMSQITLSQGIEVAIKEAVPEITELVDITNHLAGSNPYYH